MWTEIARCYNLLTSPASRILRPVGRLGWPARFATKCKSVSARAEKLLVSPLMQLVCAFLARDFIYPIELDNQCHSRETYRISFLLYTRFASMQRREGTCTTSLTGIRIRVTRGEKMTVIMIVITSHRQLRS